MKKFFLGSCVVLFFCFSNASAQQNEKVVKLLKGLHKAKPEEAKALQDNQEVIKDLPKYSPEGELIQGRDLSGFFGVAEMKYTMDLYANKQGKPQLFLVRKLSKEEQKMLKEKLKNEKMGMKGSKAPDFEVKTIKGESFHLEDLKGKMVVLNFWFVNCKGCREEMPELNRIVQKYKDNENVVFLSFALDSKKKIEKFLKKNTFDYHIVANSRNINKYYLPGAMKKYPTNILIDKKGIIRLHWYGFRSDFSKRMDEMIAENL